MTTDGRQHRASREGLDGRTPEDPVQPDALSAAFDKLRKHLSELRDYAKYFLQAKGDVYKVATRRLIVFSALAVVGAVVGLGGLVAAVVLLLSGLAGGLGELLGNRDWLGRLIVAVTVLVAAGVAVAIILLRVRKASRRKTVDKYEEQKRRQRVAYGRDVEGTR